MQQPHRSRWWWMLVGSYLLLRSLASLGRASTRFADTTGFFVVDYLGRESRLWPVPLFYSIFSNDTMRVTLHIVVGTIAWTLLTFVMARRSRFPHAISAVILLFGLSPQIIRFDLAILSESIGLSLLILLVAASVLYLSEPTRLHLFLWVTCLGVFSMVRASQIVVLFTITVIALIRLLQRRDNRQLLFAGTLAFISLWAGVQLRNNHSMSELNLYTVLQERVIPNDSRFEWFVNEGMPATQDMRGPFLYDERSDLPGELLDYIKLPVAQLPPSLIRLGGFPLAEWVRNDGWSTYLRYVVTHPGDTWSRLTELSSPTLNPRDADLLPLDNRTITPRFIFLSWYWWIIAGTVAALVHLRIGQQYFSRLFIGMCGICLVWYAGVVLTSGIEHPRHAISISVALRIVSLVTILGLLNSRKATSSDPTEVIP